LKSVDVRAPEGVTSAESLEYPGKSCFSVRKDREDFVLPKKSVDITRPANRPCHVDGALINSSTFGTLLSSQGSCAHRSQALRPGVGALALTYRVRRGPSNRFLVPDPAQIDVVHSALRAPRNRVTSRGFSLGRPPDPPTLSKVLRPVASGEAGRTLRSPPTRRQIGSVCRRSQS